MNIYNIVQGNNTYKIQEPFSKCKDDTESYFKIIQNDQELYYQYWMHQQNLYPQSYIYDFSKENIMSNASMFNPLNSLTTVSSSASSATFTSGDSISDSKTIEAWYYFSLPQLKKTVYIPQGSSYNATVPAGQKSPYQYITFIENDNTLLNDVINNYSDPDIILSGLNPIGIDSYSWPNGTTPNIASYFLDVNSYKNLGTCSIENPYNINGTRDSISVSGSPGSSVVRYFNTCVGLNFSMVFRLKHTISQPKTIHINNLLTSDILKNWINKNIVFSKTHLNSSLYSTDYFTDFTNFSPILLEPNTLYKTGSQTWSYYDDKNLLHENVSLSDYNCFTQSEIDEIFNS